MGHLLGVRPQASAVGDDDTEVVHVRGAASQVLRGGRVDDPLRIMLTPGGGGGGLTDSGVHLMPCKCTTEIPQLLGCSSSPTTARTSIATVTCVVTSKRLQNLPCS